MNIPTYGKITPYEFQWDVVQASLSHIRNQLSGKIEPEPAYMNCYVSAGKTIIAGCIARHCQKVGARLLILARTGELVEQDSDEIWNMGGQCSIYSASLDRKSTHFSTVVGTEGTVANALLTDFASWVPHIILIDECHEVSWQSVIDKSDNQYSKILNHFMEINPKLVILGMTGSPYRGTESIKGPFWKKEIEPSIGRQYLVDNEFIKPTIFGYGHDDVQYDLDEFAPENELGTKDFNSAQIQEMYKAMKLSTTQAIMHEVMDKMRNRLCALVTCAGIKHCEEAAKVVPADEMAVITDKTPKKERREILKGAKTGQLNDRGSFRYKYIFQIGCLTTGVNVPMWCTSVLLRRVGSLTLLTQLLGRGMRLLKPEHEEAGYTKHDHLVLDYSGTMAAMHQMFDDPLLDDADLAKAKQESNYITCPICEILNSEHARRCIGHDTKGDQADGRCGHWWKSRKCEDQTLNGIPFSKGCGCENDVVARECRNCGQTLIDPNAKLMNKSYGESDWKPVLKMHLEVTGKNSDGIMVTYELDSFGEDGTQEIARVPYWAIKGGGKRTWESGFVMRHVNCPKWAQKIKRFGAVAAVAQQKMFDCPTMVTHRINDKGHSIVHGLKFRSGKTLKGSKQVAA